jgi:flagellar biogenesis protein FliO
VSPYAGYVIQTVATLAAVCALAAVVLWAARRAGVGRPAGPITLVGRLPLEARRSIYLVRVGEVVLVVGAGEGGFTKLGEVPATSLPASQASASSFVPFADVLSRVLGPGKGGDGENV